MPAGPPPTTNTSQSSDRKSGIGSDVHSRFAEPLASPGMREPSTMARHSKQIPIPHSALRESSSSDFLHASPARTIAAAIVDPARTVIGFPLTRSSTVSGTAHRQGLALREIGTWRNFRIPSGKVIGQKACRSQRRRDPQPFMAGGQEDSGILRPRADERKFVGRRRPESSPGPQDRLAANSGMYSMARRNMADRISPSTSLCATSYCREDPIKICPVVLG